MFITTYKKCDINPLTQHQRKLSFGCQPYGKERVRESNVNITGKGNLDLDATKNKALTRVDSVVPVVDEWSQHEDLNASVKKLHDSVPL